MQRHMDLLERNTANPERHPWETARVEAIEALIRRLPLEPSSVLDAGCGDGFVLKRLQRNFGFVQAIAYDPQLTPSLIEELRHPGVHFVRELKELGQRVDVVLLLDVLEHVERPAELLGHLATDLLATGGSVIVTVPAFPALFTQHDRDLRHFRRYTRDEIARVAAAAGLEVVDGGYLFASLLAPRAARALCERLSGPGQGRDGIGAGHWRAPRWVTRMIHEVLCWDNRVCLAAQQRGLSLPGLSAWLICRRPS
jgi:2-polyprenyl-3-methyl-5-hydroxy-6-metoxy-1,4-benzoquinol methylase